MQMQGHSAWETPTVLTWDAWLTQLWSDYELLTNHPTALLLSHAQTKEVWAQTIVDDVRREGTNGYEYLLWNISSTASNAQTAHGILSSYRISVEAIGNRKSEDAKHFLIWRDQYQSKLEKNNWLDLETLPDRIKSVPDIDFSTLRIAFVGFSDWTPQQKSFERFLKEIGADVHLLEHSTSNPCKHVQSFEFENTDQELKICARWARAVIEDSPNSNYVGIVIPNISSLQNRVRRIFSSILHPGFLLEDRRANNMSFHITVGTPLRKSPIIVDIFNLLVLIRPDVEITVMQEIIVSDRLKGWDVEFEERLRLAEDLVAIGSGLVSIQDVVKFAIAKKFQCPELCKLLSIADCVRNSAPEWAAYAYWGQFVVQWLSNFMDTKVYHRKLSTDEVQAHRAWMSILDDLPKLGIVTDRINVDTALRQLSRLVNQQNIQSRAVRVPIQVGEDISMLGQSFTHMWILNLNNQNWPKTQDPNPFVPRSVQKQFGVPACSPELQKQRLDHRMSMLLSCTYNLIQSYAKLDGDVSYHPSAVLGQFEEFQVESDSVLHRYKDYHSVILAQRHRCESFFDWKVDSVENPGDLRRGVSILKHQSNCPFRAYAEHRLGTKSTNKKFVGFTAMEKGSIAHEMFEKIYESFTTRSTLNSQKQEYLDTARKYAEKILLHRNEVRIQPFPEQWLELEVDRLTDLAKQWFQIEVKRPNFTVIATEKMVEVEVRGMKFRIRIDRIDELEPGMNVVIDYKTGYCSIKHVIGDRPEDPQLMIYALALQNIVDVAYAKIKHGEVNYYTYSNGKEAARLSANDIESWRETLSSLADEFLRGNCAVDPLVNSCKYCHIKPVCRIGDQSEHLTGN